MSGIVRAVHQSSSKLGDTPLVRLDLFESLPSRRFGCRASTTNSTTKSRSTSLYNAPASSRGGCRALQLYSALHLYSSTALYTLHPLHPPSARHRATSRPDPVGTSQQGPEARARGTWVLACTRFSGKQKGKQRVPSTLRFRKFPGKTEGVWCSILETREFP